MNMSQEQPRVLVAGDSFTYGSELIDRDNVWWKHIWPDAECIARFGASNQEIVRKIVQHDLSNIDKVVVMFSFPDRYEFNFNIPTNHPGDNWLTIGKLKETPDIKKFTETFYKYVGTNQTYKDYTNFKEFTFLELFLKDKNIDYKFLYCDWFSGYGPDINQEANWVHITDDKKGFLNWAIQNDYDRGPGLHPLDQAHIDYAKELKKWLG